MSKLNVLGTPLLEMAMTDLEARLMGWTLDRLLDPDAEPPTVEDVARLHPEALLEALEAAADRAAKLGAPAAVLARIDEFRARLGAELLH